jgi:hypothetical protein
VHLPHEADLCCFELLLLLLLAAAAAAAAATQQVLLLLHPHVQLLQCLQCCQWLQGALVHRQAQGLQVCAEARQQVDNRHGKQVLQGAVGVACLCPSLQCPIDAPAVFLAGAAGISHSEPVSCCCCCGILLLLVCCWRCAVMRSPVC